ncbi:MAG: hypothetical protein V1820_06495 [archaeon]
MPASIITFDDEIISRIARARRGGTVDSDVYSTKLLLGSDGGALPTEIKLFIKKDGAAVIIGTELFMGVPKASDYSALVNRTKTALEASRDEKGIVLCDSRQIDVSPKSRMTYQNVTTSSADAEQLVLIRFDEEGIQNGLVSVSACYSLGMTDRQLYGNFCAALGAVRAAYTPVAAEARGGP